MGKGVDRRRFLEASGCAAIGIAAAPLVAVAGPEFDLLLTGGTVVDGTGGPTYVADVGIVGESIAAVGAIPSGRAKRSIDAKGLHVAPGFVDIHTHSDSTVLRHPTCDSRVLQGVTTEVTGNCGSCAALLSGIGAEQRRKEWLEESGIRA